MAAQDLTALSDDDLQELFDTTDNITVLRAASNERHRRYLRVHERIIQDERAGIRRMIDDLECRIRYLAWWKERQALIKSASTCRICHSQTR